MRVIGVGGSLRPSSSTELILRAVLDGARQRGHEVELFSGEALVLPPYEPGVEAVPAAERLVAALRAADAVAIGSPGYHGSISGLVKNALDYVEELRCDERPYLDRRPVACIATGSGWQGAVHTLGALRDVVHALRGWPTPLGLAINTRDPGQFAEARIVSPSILEQVSLLVDQLLEFDAVRAA